MIPWPFDEDPVAQSLCVDWNFHPQIELPRGHCSRVYADAERVLKVPFVGEERESGMRAALLLSRHGGPRVDGHDPSTGSLLMQRLSPGTPMALEDDQAIPTWAGILQRWADLPTEGLMPMDAYYPRPDPLRDRLLETAPPSRFLHGDLHHFNILRHGDTWVPIDPKGLVGELAFEAPAFLRNFPLGDPSGEALVNRTRVRIRSIAVALHVDPWRVCAWAIVDRRDGLDEIPEGHPWHELLFALEALLPEFGG